MAQSDEQSGQATSSSSFQTAPPSIALPKGGGAIRGMGEKFAANPVTGTGSMTVPIYTSPGRSGFGPQLALSYDSAAGNGPFGFGWSLSLPSITRKTDKGLPKYQDASNSDVFILSGAEDLVPEFEKDAGGNWVLVDGKHVIHDKLRTVGNASYRVRRYRPRIEGLFARIERWTDSVNPAEVFWRSISKDNITTWYGKTTDSRICDPGDQTRTFSWLICQTYDDKGNAVVYEYKEENSDNVDASQANERNRTDDALDQNKSKRTANRYIKRIYYGNRQPYLPKLEENSPWPDPPGPGLPNAEPNWFFEAVFDYDDGHYLNETAGHEGRVFAHPVYSPGAKWSARVDPFSTYRAGFEVRTYRLCQRALMFHHFPAELGTRDCLVRSTDFTYSYELNPKNERNPIYSFLDSVSQSGYVRQADQPEDQPEDTYLKRTLPPLQFEYTKPEVQQTLQDVDSHSLENVPYGLDGTHYQWVDLDGEGLSGILTEQGDGWFYKRNLSPVNVGASFARIELVASKPSMSMSGPGQQFLDLAGDGRLELAAFGGPAPGFFERSPDDDWESFKSFRSLPNLDWSNPNLRFVDLTGDGHADILITEDDVFQWHPSLAEDGFGSTQRVQQSWDEEKGPRLVLADAEHTIQLADFSGDGLSDLVRIRNGEVCYWPNLGYGRFGAKVTMDHSPRFDDADQFDPRRILLADIDGSGTTDIIYLGTRGVDLYFNQCGNSWGQPQRVTSFPGIDNVSFVTALDLRGNGTACLVLSSPLPADGREPMRYIDLMGEQKPHLLVHTVNNLGGETTVRYAPSTKFYVRDMLDGQPWISRIPFPVHVVEKVTVNDKWRRTEFSSTYSYHHGYYDGIEREFRGFGRVEQVDTEEFGPFALRNTNNPYVTGNDTLYQPPVQTVTWFHTGAFLDRDRILSQFEREYFPNWYEAIDPNKANVLGTFHEHPLPEPDLALQDLSDEEWREALRACKGMMLRQEAYELDVRSASQSTPRRVKLFSTACHNCQIQRLQPQEQNPHAVFLVTESEAINYHYELALPSAGGDLTPDPRIAHALNLRIDEIGNILQSVAVAYPRVKTSLSAQVLADHPIAYYRFGEAAGEGSVRDLSGNGNEGELSATGVTLGTPGLGHGDTAALFDGEDGRIIVPNSDSLNPAHITMEAMVRWDGPHPLSAGIYQRICEKSSFPQLAQYGFGILPDGRVHVELRTSQATTTIDVNSIAVVAQRAKTHIVVAYDGNVIRIYLNGILDSDTNAPGSISPKPPTPANLIESGLGIGNQTERSRPFNGVIDELALYARPLTIERIRAHLGLDVIDQVQGERHLAYTETRYTNDVIQNDDNHRLRMPCEVESYELTGFSPARGFYFDLSDLRGFRLSDSLPNQGATAIANKPYHELPQIGLATKRLVERVRTLFLNDDATGPDAPTDFLKKPLPLGTLGRLGLTYEQYKLALTDGLLDAVFGARLDDVVDGQAARSVLTDAGISGYLPGANNDYWICSGVAGFNADAPQHFYLPERYTDPFGNSTTINYDVRDLYITGSTDPLDNSVEVTAFDFRVLAPSEMKDANDNYSAVAFDALGMPVASAVMGKSRTESGDNLRTVPLDIPIIKIEEFFSEPVYDESTPREWLEKATARFFYGFGEHIENNGTVTYGHHPAGACAITREQHVTGGNTEIQVAIEYSDAGGKVLVKKSQAEPHPVLNDGVLRWIAAGKTVVNNKGKPVKQYEPYFSDTKHRFDATEAQQEVGVTPVLYYDAPGRLVRTELPDGSFTRVEFSPWQVTTFDQNDTAFDASENNQSDWFKRRTDPAHTRFAEYNNAEDRRAADLVKIHAGTPSQVFLDSLGREVVSLAHNKFAYSNGTSGDEKHATFTKLDAEGKPLWVRDALGHLVMQYISPPKPNNDPDEDVPYRVDLVTNDRIYSVPCYDIAGNLLFQHSMDAGDRWMLMDASGKPMLAWDFNERQDDDGAVVSEQRVYFHKYDRLHRPTEIRLHVNGGAGQMIERFEYRDVRETNLDLNLQLNVDQDANNIGQLVRHYDSSGLVETSRRDFKNNVIEVQRTLVRDAQASRTDWRDKTNPDGTSKLEADVYSRITNYDALNRMTSTLNWHRGVGSYVAVYTPAYNKRGLLGSESLRLHARKTANGIDETGSTLTNAIKEIRYNEKGQKTYLWLDNGTTTQYTYERETFRLIHLYTRRDNRFLSDCDTNPDAARPPRPCGVQNLHYTYDPVGNITNIQDDAQQTIYFRNQVAEPSNDYTYDALYRLIEARGREQAGVADPPSIPEGNWPRRTIPTNTTLRRYTQRYEYDAVGNFRVMDHNAAGGDWTRHYTYAFDDSAQPVSNRLWQSWIGNNAGNAVTYEYDRHGSMRNLGATPDEFFLHWDHRDMIRHIKLGGGGDVWYQYDSEKQRTRKYIKRNGTGIEERIYLGGFERYRRTVAGNVVEEIESHHLFEGEERVLLVDDVSTADPLNPGPNGLPVEEQTLFRYQYGNHLGSASLELDPEAKIISYEEYHPYGTSAYRTMNDALQVPAKRYRYTGMERDEESGLNYHSARYYSTPLGRWVSCDPSGIEAGINFWLYANANPVRFNDPTGERAPTATEAEVLKFFNDLADKKDKSTKLPDEILARLPPFSRSAGMDAKLLRTHAERLSAAIERARGGESIVKWPVAHQDPSAKYTSFSEGRGFDPFATIPIDGGGSLELETDPQYMTDAAFQSRAATNNAWNLAWNNSAMPAMTAFNDLTGSMGGVEGGSGGTRGARAKIGLRVPEEHIGARRGGIRDPVVNDVPYDPAEPLEQQKAGQVCVPATAVVIGIFQGKLDPATTVSKLESMLGTDIGLGAVQMQFSTPESAAHFVGTALGLKATRVSSANPFSPSNPGTFAIIEPNLTGGHMTFGVVLPNGGGMYIWDPLIGGSTRSVDPNSYMPPRGTQIYKFD